MNNVPKFTIGCDPEIFVTKRAAPFSAYGILEGTKDQPHKTDGGAYQVDGMAAEFNTDPVALRDHRNFKLENFTTWNDLIIKQIKQIRDALPDNCNLSIVPTMEFGKEFLDEQPAAAKELGCDPDFSAYTMKANPRPDGEKTFRTGAGHIHVGWGAEIPVDNETHLEICSNFVKMLDCTVGMFMTYVDRDPRRRELYGKAGAFRPKPYGVEYRTPSNVWIKNRDMRRCVWELVQMAITFQTSRYGAEAVTGYTQDQIEEIINTGDVVRAQFALEAAFRADHKVNYRWQQFKLPAYYNRIVAAVTKEYANA